MKKRNPAQPPPTLSQELKPGEIISSMEAWAIERAHWLRTRHFITKVPNVWNLVWGIPED